MLSGSKASFPLEYFSLAVPGRSNCQANFNNILTEPADGCLPVPNDTLHSCSTPHTSCSTPHTIRTPKVSMVTFWPSTVQTQTACVKLRDLSHCTLGIHLRCPGAQVNTLTLLRLAYSLL
jgi:hypothetical protein